VKICPAYQIHTGYIQLYGRYLPVWRWYDELGKNEQPDKYYNTNQGKRLGEWLNLYIIDMRKKEGVSRITPQMVHVEYDSNLFKLPTVKIEFSDSFKRYIDWFLNKRKSNDHYEYNPKLTVQ